EHAEAIGLTAPASDHESVVRPEPASSAASLKSRKSPKADRENQMDLFGKHVVAEEASSEEISAPARRLESDDTASPAAVIDAAAAKEHKHAPSHASRPRPLANAAEVRKAVHEII